MKTTLLRVLSSLLFSLSITTASYGATVPLEGRLPATQGGNDYQAYYDPNLDISWSANANINGDDSWSNQMDWASTLIIGGVNGWRLASVDVNGDGTVVDCTGGGVVGCADNEMAFLFVEEGVSAAHPSPFSNVQSNRYWSTEFDNTSAWNVAFSTGFTLTAGKAIALFAWPVHNGDVGAVPIPAAVWFLGSGLIGLIGLTRKG